MNWITRKRALLAISGVAVLALAGGAFAYFTSTGAGTGTATVGSSNAIVLHATVSNTLYPGVSSPVVFTLDNPTSGGPERVGTISLSSITADAGHSTCSVVTTGGNPDFTMAPVAVNKVFPTGLAQVVTPGGTLAMNDTGISQDACQGATLTLHLVNN